MHLRFLPQQRNQPSVSATITTTTIIIILGILLPSTPPETTTIIIPTLHIMFNLQQSDPELHTLIQLEGTRLHNRLELIASENFCILAAWEGLGSCLANKYSEGNVGKRYCGGNERIDKIETLCISRDLELYHLYNEEWGLNVQPYSVSLANFAVYMVLLDPHERLWVCIYPRVAISHILSVTTKWNVSATSVYFESLPYVVNPDTGYIDYDNMQHRALIFIASGSAYARGWDYERMRQIADSVDALPLVDMVHTSGLIEEGMLQSLFPYADVVTTTTYNTLRGPRSGLIFGHRDLEAAIELNKIQFAHNCVNY